MKPKDYPLLDCVAKADELVKRGCRVYQKFTCSGCGKRLTIETPNVFHTQGTCDNCSAITNIARQGCNYMLIT
jgi:hypothetical protein